MAEFGPNSTPRNIRGTPWRTIGILVHMRLVRTGKCFAGGVWEPICTLQLYTTSEELIPPSTAKVLLMNINCI